MSQTIYIIAGEASGDVIGGGLLTALQAKKPGLRIYGIGGTQMQAAGLSSSLFQMQELSLMGFAEVLPHIFRLKRRIRETVADILRTQPEVLITIDSPGFVFRVVKALREAGFRKPCIHYVAPTVWAYKPQRAAKTARLFDALLCILPFEPPYFENKGLRAEYVGHPIAWQHRQRGNGSAFRSQHAIAPEAELIGMMPGSRRGEIARHLSIFRATAEALIPRFGGLQIIIPTNADLLETLQKQTQDWPLPVHLLSRSADKADALAACNAALAKSGTVALETALAGLPTVTAFRANPLSAWLVRRLINIPYVNLINIMAYFDRAEPPIPEFLQEKCRADTLAPALAALLSDTDVAARQRADCAHYFDRLGMNEAISPSEKAASIILEYLR